MSAKFETLVTPEGWTFLIWSVIFSFQGALVVYNCLWDVPAVSNRFITAWVALMAAGGLWSVPFALQYLKVALALMLLCLGSLVVLYLETYPGNASAFPIATGKFWSGKMVVSLQLAWISVATIVNVAVVLTDLGWTRHDPSAVPAAVTMLFVATALAFLFLVLRNDVIFASVCIWAFFGIRAHQQDETVHDVATGAASCLVGAVLLSIFWTLSSRRGAIPVE
eukprot:EG_transcript_15643